MENDSLQEKLQEMEMKNPSPSLEDTEPSLREKAYFSERKFKGLVEKKPIQTQDPYYMTTDNGEIKLKRFGDCFETVKEISQKMGETLYIEIVGQCRNPGWVSCEKDKKRSLSDRLYGFDRKSIFIKRKEEIDSPVSGRYLTRITPEYSSGFNFRYGLDDANRESIVKTETNYDLINGIHYDWSIKIIFPISPEDKSKDMKGEKD